MAKSRKRRRRPRTGWPRAKLNPIEAGGWFRLGMQSRSFEAGVRERYDVDVLKSALHLGLYEARVRVIVPIYNIPCVLHVKIDGNDASLPAKITVDDFPNDFRHVYPDGYLCMWKPWDPPDTRWRTEDGLRKLLDTTVTHLFKERHYALHPEEGWIGEEVAHAPSSKPREEPDEEGDESVVPPSKPQRPPTRLQYAA